LPVRPSPCLFVHSIPRHARAFPAGWERLRYSLARPLSESSNGRNKTVSTRFVVLLADIKVSGIFCFYQNSADKPPKPTFPYRRLFLPIFFQRYLAPDCCIFPYLRW